MLLRMPELELKLVVTASHDTVGRAKVAAKYLSSVGAAHVPIAVGIPTDNATGALFGWAAGFDLASYAGGVRVDGIAAMRDVIDASSEPVALIEIGPHTNAQALFERHPATAASVRVYAMGGSVVPGIHLPWGSITPVATTNERSDVPAARALLQAKWGAPVQWAPVATTIDVVINGPLWQKLVHADSPLVRVLLECYMYWWSASRADPRWITHGEALMLDPARSSATLFDVEAVHLAGSARWLVMYALTVNFTDDGHTLVLPPSSPLGSHSFFALNWTTSNSSSEHEARKRESGVTAFLEHVTSLLLG